MKNAVGRLFLGGAFFVLCGCATLPGPVMPLQGPAPDPLGSTSARLYALDAILSDKNVDQYGAGGLRLTHQFTPGFAAGIEGTYVNGLGSANAQQLFAGRAHGKWSFLDGHLALTVGAGVQRERARNTGEAGTQGTGDIGLSAGWRSGRLGFYGMVSNAMGFASWETGTFRGWLYGGIGVDYRPTRRWRLSAELSSFFANYSSSTFSFSNPIVMPTISAGYVFGGSL